MGRENLKQKNYEATIKTLEYIQKLKWVITVDVYMRIFLYNNKTFFSFRQTSCEMPRTQMKIKGC